MGDFLPDIDSLKDSAQELVNGFAPGTFPLPTNLDPIYGAAISEQVFADQKDKSVPWSVDGTDWYKVFAYQFAVIVDNSVSSNNASTFVGPPTPKPSTEFLYTLPIPPQAMNTRMVPASQVTPTVGGVVEETGANVFWLINMSGTTGIAVSRNSQVSSGGLRKKMASEFRDKITTTGLLSGPLAGINSAISKIGGVADQIVQAASADSVASVIGGVVGAANTALLPPLPYAGSAVQQKTNGYTEIQELHRFLYTYSKLKGANPGKYSLRFRNFKTNQEWQCILQDFQIQQSAANPMLYRYNISLKCWGVTTPNADLRKGAEYDRFGADGDLKAVSTIDPIQMANLFKTMAKTISGQP